MNETNSKVCIKIINKKNNESSEITEKSKTNNGFVDLMDLDPNGSSSRRPLDDNSGSLHDDSGLLNDEPAPFESSSPPGKEKACG